MDPGAGGGAIERQRDGAEVAGRRGGREKLPPSPRHSTASSNLSERGGEREGGTVVPLTCVSEEERNLHTHTYTHTVYIEWT